MQRAVGIGILTAVFVLSGCDASFTDLRMDAGGVPEIVAGYDGGVSGTELVLGRGAVSGRAGHNGAGTASLVQHDDGSLEVRFASDFAVSNAPGPLVVLSSRESLGSALDPAADQVLARLSKPSGAQSYPVEGDDVGRRIVWVFCDPFKVEIARAILEEAQ
jgi:hypothetical protein